MYTRLTVTLKITEREALHALALQELRDTGSQAALIIRQELERRGLIQPPTIENKSMIMAGQNG